MADGQKDRVSLNKAIEALQPAAARASASSETLALYGRALLLSGDVGGAEVALQQAITRTPVDPLAYLYLAEAAGRLRHTALASRARTRYQALSDAPAVSR
jgi:predicted Zn-dependent protease